MVIRKKGQITLDPLLESSNPIHPDSLPKPVNTVAQRPKWWCGNERIKTHAQATGVGKLGKMDDGFETQE